MTGVVTDNGDEESDLTIRWSSDLDGAHALDTPPDSAGSVLGSAYLTEGGHTVLRMVEDASGKVGTTIALVSAGSWLSDYDGTIGASTTQSRTVTATR